MKHLVLAILAAISLNTPVFAQTLAPLDLPAVVLVNETGNFNAQLLAVHVCNATSGNIVCTLPDATQVPAGKGLVVVLKLTGSSHHVSFATTNSQTINTLSASSFSSASELTAAATSLSFVSDGANWVASAGSV